MYNNNNNNKIKLKTPPRVRACTSASGGRRRGERPARSPHSKAHPPAPPPTYQRPLAGPAAARPKYFSPPFFS